MLSSVPPLFCMLFLLWDNFLSPCYSTFCSSLSVAVSSLLLIIYLYFPSFCPAFHTITFWNFEPPWNVRTFRSYHYWSGNILWLLILLYCMYWASLGGAQIFQTSRHHVRIVGASNVAGCKFCTEDPQILGAAIKNQSPTWPGVQDLYTCACMCL